MIALLAADTDSGKAGPLGLLLVIVLGVAIYFLYRSMTRHIKKVPASFDEPRPSAEDRPADPPAAGQ